MKVHIGKWPKDPNKERKVDVRIDSYDTWEAFETLSLIILPLLKKFKEENNGTPITDDDDVPESLKSNLVQTESNYEIDVNYHARWEWILDEMIFAFESIVDNSWEDQFYKEGYEEYDNRIKNGLILFGKYFRALWN